MWTALVLGSIAFADEPPVEAPPAPPAEAAAPEAPKKEKKPKKPDPKWVVAGLPIANYSTVTGIGYGGFASVVHTEVEGSPDPYKARLAVQAFWTTKKYQDHNLRFDFPSILGSKFRVDGVVGYERWKESPYYGAGNFNPRLNFDDLPGTVDAQGAPVLDDDGNPIPNPHYNQYDVAWMRALVNVRRQVGDTPWWLFGNYLFRWAKIELYDDVEGGSLLELDKPYGWEGGRYSRLGLGVMYDTRDAEPSPHAGVFSEASLRLSSPILGGQEWVVGLNVTDRRYYTLAWGGRLVFASRAVLDVKRGNEPFWVGHLLGSTQLIEYASSNNMRGIDNGRYRGDIYAFWTPELRITAIQAGWLSILLCPFFDVGRTFVWPDDAVYPANAWAERETFPHLHYAGGLGLRIQVSTAMLVRLDVAFGRDEQCVTTGGVCDPATSAVKGIRTLGFHLVFDHPF